MTELAKQEDNLVARQEAAERLQQDLKLSLGQRQNIPNMLMTAPTAISLLGQIRLLAFSDHALRIRLTEPRYGFKHLQRSSLSSAMVQIVQQASNAFDLAEKNLRTNRMQANVMFGRTGHVAMILMCLQDPVLARKNLIISMDCLEKEIQACADRAKQIEEQIEVLVHCTDEVNLAMADEAGKTQVYPAARADMSTERAAIEKDRMTVQAMKAEEEQEIQNNALSVYKLRVKDAEEEFNKARARYQKTSNKGERSAIATAAAIGFGRSVSGLVNATINVFKAAPSMAIEITRAASSIGTSRRTGSAPPVDPGESFINEGNIQNSPPRCCLEPCRSIGIDPALLAAESIEAQLREIQRLLPENESTLSQDHCGAIQAKAHELEALKNGLSGFESNHTRDASYVLDEALKVTTAIANYYNSDKSEPGASALFEEQKYAWRNAIKSLYSKATRLRAFAASQPGQGFGTTLEMPIVGQAMGGSSYSRVLHERHQTLLIKRGAMNEARQNFERTTQLQLEAQAKLVGISRTMKQLRGQQATLEDTKKLLLKSSDIMSEMKAQLQRLANFFSILASVISIQCKGAGQQYLGMIRGSMTGSDEKFTLASIQGHVKIIREAVITLRGHFSFIVDSARMYQQIADDHLNPCLRMAATLPLSAGQEEQERAQQYLEQTANDSSQAIMELAHKQMNDFFKTLDRRVEEIDGEISTLGLPATLSDRQNLQAITEGVRESSKEIVKEVEKDSIAGTEILSDL